MRHVLKALFLATILCLGTPPTVVVLTRSAVADANQVSEEMAKNAIWDAIKAAGGEIIGVPTDISIDPLVEYLSNPTGKDVKAAVTSFAEGFASLSFPALGIAIKGGKILIGGSTAGVQLVVDEAHRQQLLATIFGGSSFGNLFSQVGFFSIGAVANQGITPANIGEKVTSLEALKTLWFTQYARVLHDLFKGEEESVDNTLKEAWPLLVQYWASKRAQIALDRLADELAKRAASLAAKGGGGADKDTLTLLDMSEANNFANPPAGWSWDPRSGTARQQSADGVAEYGWSIPASVRPTSNVVSFRARATAVKGNDAFMHSMAAHIEVGACCEVSPVETTYIGITAKPGETQQQEKTYSFAFDPLSHELSLDVLVGGKNIAYKYGRKP
jgi:hypothetical protein